MRLRIRVGMNNVAAIVAGLILLAACLLAGCNRGYGETTYEEVMRVKSQDGKFDAVLISAWTDVIGNNSHLLYIVPAGSKFNKNDAAFGRSYLSVRCFEGLKLVWRESKMLEVQYQEALIDEFRNCANVTENPDSPHVLELRLSPQGASALPDKCPCLK
jgi:hypothetical protein